MTDKTEKAEKEGAAPGAAAAKSTAKLVKMKREGDILPTTADVHPSQVAEYEAIGWVKA